MVFVPYNTSIFATPGTATLVKRANTTAFPLVFGNASYVKLSGLWFDGNALNQIEQSYSTVYFNTPNFGFSISISDCAIYNASTAGHALHIKGYDGVSVTRTIVVKGGSRVDQDGFFHAIYFRRVRNALVANCEISDFIGGQGIKMTAGSGNTEGTNMVFSNNRISTVRRGINASDYKSVVITGNVIEYATGYGIRLGIEEGTALIGTVVGNTLRECYLGIGIIGVSGTTVTGNSIYNSAIAGVYSRGAAQVILSGNQISNDPAMIPVGPVVAGIFLDGPASGLAVTGNNLRPGITNTTYSRYGVYDNATGSLVTMQANVVSTSGLTAQVSSQTILAPPYRLPYYAVATMPSCNTQLEGSSSFTLAVVTDSIYGRIVVYCDGAGSWRRVIDGQPLGGNSSFTTTAASATTISLAPANTLVATASSAGFLVGSGVSLAVGTTGPFFYLPGIAGTPTGIPTRASSAYIACAYDTLNDKHCCYNGGWKCSGGYSS